MESQAEQGSAAAPGELTRLLPSASAPFMEGALDNPGITPAHVLLILRSPRLTPALIGRIASRRGWLSIDRIRACLALHPRTPRRITFLLLPLLGWRHLASIAEHPRLDPRVRRMAEQRIAGSLGELAQGERISLARIAGRGLIAPLCEDDSPRVIGALLRNPRILENDVLRLIARRTAPAPVLQTVADDERFGRRREIQKGIVRHPSTPSPVALRLLRFLSEGDLRELLRAPGLPRLIEIAASRLVRDSPAGGDSGGFSGAPAAPPDQ
jgi:hypothetical protein